MDALAFIQRENLKIEEYLLNDMDVPYWHTNIIDQYGTPLAGGFGPSKDISRKIAFAECLERRFYLKVSGNRHSRNEWGLNVIATGCGFAAGFALRNTILRSIGEGLERWTLSKWIDEHYFMNPLPNAETSAAAKWFLSKFDRVLFFRKDLAVPVNNEICTFVVCASVAFKNGGAYLGSAARQNEIASIEHSLLESYRHLLIKSNTEEQNSFPDNRVRYFGANGAAAKHAIALANKVSWPSPNLNLHRHDYIDNEYFIARTIFDGWASWEVGPVSRFLY